MSAEPAVFTEAGAEPKTQSTPLSHLSVEVGHLYMEDYAAGPERLREHFAQVRPWLDAAESRCAAELGGSAPRISTCFLVDDYFSEFGTPQEVVSGLLEAADEAGVRIDYIARESACARTGGVSPAELVEARLVGDPPPGTTGARPPVRESGWLSNGERSPGGVVQAMERPAGWTPPRENAVNRHSVFLDVELWDDRGDGRTWSCPFLAAVWQLFRLGLVRDRGAVVVEPEPWEPDGSARWDELPAVMRIGARPQPFAAYRTFSVLDVRFLHIEHAVRTILGQVMVEPAVAAQVAARAAAERVDLPETVVGRMEYLFTGPRWSAAR